MKKNPKRKKVALIITELTEKELKKWQEEQMRKAKELLQTVFLDCEGVPLKGKGKISMPHLPPNVEKW